MENKDHVMGGITHSPDFESGSPEPIDLKNAEFFTPEEVRRLRRDVKEYRERLTSILGWWESGDLLTAGRKDLEWVRDHVAPPKQVAAPPETGERDEEDGLMAIMAAMEANGPFHPYIVRYEEGDRVEGFLKDVQYSAYPMVHGVGLYLSEDNEVIGVFVEDVSALEAFFRARPSMSEPARNQDS